MFKTASFQRLFANKTLMINPYFQAMEITEGRIALFTSELVESDLIMLQKNRAGHGQGQGYKF